MEVGIILFGVPLASIAWFIYDLVLFLKCPKEEVEKRKKCRIQMILSAILALFFVGTVTSVIYFFSRAVQHM